MVTTKKSFWKNVNWKSFAVTSLFFFIATYLVAYIMEKADVYAEHKPLFTTSEILHRLVTALFTGLVFSLIFNPLKRRHKKENE